MASDKHGNGHAVDDSYIEEVKKHYDSNSHSEWERMDRAPLEFTFSLRMLKKHIKKGDRVLDIGGGPGRYSIELAKMGCDVVLLDLSDKEIELGRKKAEENNVKIDAYSINCLDLDGLDIGTFDHVLMMGPIYHLIREEHRIKAVELALKKVKTGGKIYVSFLLNVSGIIGMLNGMGSGRLAESMKLENIPRMIESIVNGKSFDVESFTIAHFEAVDNIEPFMEKFGLERVAMFGMYGILASHGNLLAKCSEEEYDKWIELSEKLFEARDFLPYSQQVMYIGRKTD